jgi:hypothetical protein
MFVGDETWGQWWLPNHDERLAGRLEFRSLSSPVREDVPDRVEFRWRSGVV